jgi:hypothetical protein
MKFIHATKAKYTNFFERNQHRKDIKPRGLWYAPEDIWIQFTKKNMGMSKKWQEYKYFYHVKLHYTKFSKPDQNKVLQIKTEQDFLDVTFKYGYLSGTQISDFIGIDWEKLTKDYGGIEIIPFPKKLQEITDPKLIKEFKDHGWKLTKKPLSITWLDPIDISGGCVWRKKALKSIKEIDKDQIIELWEKEKEKHVRFIMDRNKKKSKNN